MIDTAFESRVTAATSDVDLDIAFSPVLPLPAGSHIAADVPVRVSHNVDGSFSIHHSGGGGVEVVTAEQLRPMRARFLLRKGDHYLRLPTMGRRERNRILDAFFEGKASIMIGAMERQLTQAPTMGEPLLTVPIDQADPDGLRNALAQALDQLGPTVVLKSSQQMQREYRGSRLEAEMREMAEPVSTQSEFEANVLALLKKHHIVTAT